LKDKAISEEVNTSGLTVSDLENAVIAARGSQKPGETENAGGKYENLEKYGQDLVQAARDGKLDPVIGRDEEVRRVIQILSRRRKK